MIRNGYVRQPDGTYEREYLFNTSARKREVVVRSSAGKLLRVRRKF